ncbi:hypothetical protein [Novipirellula artificiosorum]|uniref:Uncharacterized protein n=1 Tax=Novipirellula artificiosorum TaxID=2528016 RepID=A0A5C6DTZ4_9BACT|nr:hypothetical protein [Novipirellula artificiosorum]TWU40833.1 hypothetical protein Poly41_16680 [Novipirellula artificiosorum]
MNPHDRNAAPIEARLADSPRGEGRPNRQDSKRESWAESRGAVFAMLFLVTGVLGIPLLWMNKKFSNPERYFWSILVTLYTAALIYGAYLVCMWSYHRIFGYS